MIYGRLLVNLNEWPLSGDIRNLDDMIIILLSEEIVQKHKDELDNMELPTDKYALTYLRINIPVLTYFSYWSTDW